MVLLARIGASTVMQFALSVCDGNLLSRTCCLAKRLVEITLPVS
jgi:hypothetical protein